MTRETDAKNTPTAEPAGTDGREIRVSVRDLQVGYGSFVLMRDVNFDVRAGDVFFIMGGSGCGKSTLLRVLMGLKSPQAGQVLYDGTDFWGGGEDGRFTAAAVAFILNYACYFSEIYRGGIEGVPIGQQEAGQVLGMTKSEIFFKITLLQMVKRIVPPMSNEIITLVKDTSLARIIALQEIIWAGQAFLKGSYGISGQIWPLFFTAVYYLVFCGVLTILFGKLEKKLDYFKI